MPPKRRKLDGDTLDDSGEIVTVKVRVTIYNLFVTYKKRKSKVNRKNIKILILFFIFRKILIFNILYVTYSLQFL